MYHKASDKKWIEKNRDHKRYLSKRSTARSFIRNDATPDDILEIKNIIRKKELEMSVEYKYEVIMGDTYPLPDKTFETTSEAKAKATARKWAKENPGQNIVISFYRASDGQRGYINPDGADLHAVSWGIE